MNAPVPPTGMTQAEIDDMFLRLSSRAELEKQAFMSRNTPPLLQPQLKYLQDQAAAGAATVPNGALVSVKRPDGTDLGTGVAVVIDGQLDHVELDVADMVRDGDGVPVVDAVGTAYPGTPGVCKVTNRQLVNVQKVLPASNAIIANGDNVPLVDEVDAPIPGWTATATVGSGRLNNVKLIAA